MNREEVQRIFRDPPVLTTNRLILRRMLKSDYRDMYEYACQPRVTRYLLWHPHDSEAYTCKYLQYIQSRYRLGEFYDWAVVLKDPEGTEKPFSKGKMIGTCGFTRFHNEHNAAEIGYVLNPAWWGRGLATEAVSAVLRFGFVDLRLHRIEARYMTGNDASRRVMEKAGMTFEGIARESMLVKGEFVSVGTCSILRSEYFHEGR
ncbi:MAG: GNAT family N-acetyltransferase [Ruminococcaceae bacterium]|nr:GNAT family N-acetyltransferase [Oscillospiraceae bacterium]